MGIGTCAFNGLYTAICRDKDTAAGGLNPDNTVLHASGFYRHFGDRIDELPGDGIDRKVQVVYEGTDKWIPYGSSNTSTRMRDFTVVIRIGYFAGSHVDETMAVIADDEHQIAAVIAKSTSFPTCSPGCVMGYVPASSNVVKLDNTRYILEIVVGVQVMA